MPTERLTICAVEELKPGDRRIVKIGPYNEVLVLNIDGAIHAINNACPHAGAAMQRGPVRKGVLYCPLHLWGFKLDTGACIDGEPVRAPTYEVERVDDTWVLCLPT